MMFPGDLKRYCVSVISTYRKPANVSKRPQYAILLHKQIWDVI